MNKIIKYIPSFCYGVMAEVSTFSTLEELLKVSFVENAYNWYENTFVGVFFKQFSVMKYYDRYLLICEFIEDSVPKYDTIGYIDNLEGLSELPYFEQEKYKNCK